MFKGLPPFFYDFFSTTEVKDISKLDYNYSDYARTIEFDNTKPTEKIKQIVNNLKYKDTKDKIFITTSLIMIVKLAQKIDLSKIIKLEKYATNSNWNLLNGYTETLNPFVLSVGPVVTSRIMISVLSSSISPICKTFEDKKLSKKVEVILTFFLGFANGLMINNGITTASVLVSIVLGLGCLILGKITDIISKKGVADGVTTIISSDNICTGEPELIIGSLLLSKLNSAKSKSKIINKNGVNDKITLPIKLFNNGAMPIIIANSLIAVFSGFMPTLTNPLVISYIQCALIFISNLLLSKQINTKDIDKSLKTNSLAIHGVDIKTTKEYLDKKILFSSVTSGLILVTLVLIPNILGISVNVAGMIIISNFLYQIYERLSVKKINKAFLS